MGRRPQVRLYYARVATAVTGKPDPSWFVIFCMTAKQPGWHVLDPQRCGAGQEEAPACTPETVVARPTYMEKTIEAFYFDPDYLSEVSARYSAGYNAAK